METMTHPVARKLLTSFMQFDRAEWHQRSIAGCRPSEIRVLLCIRTGGAMGAPDMKVSEISRRLHVTSPTVTQLLKGLEARGLVERHVDPTDRRAVGITLTERGGMVAQQAADAFIASLHGLVEYLGEDESDHLATLLSKVFRYYNETAASMHQAHWHGDEDAFT